MLLAAICSLGLSHAAAPTSAGASALATSLCHAPEKTYFTCRTTNHKIISLCGALPGRLQYRFGTPNKVEMQFPDHPEDGVKLMRYVNYSRPLTNYTDIIFDRGAYTYTLFDIDDEEPGEVSSTGVDVDGGNGHQAEYRCTSPQTGALVEPGKYMKCDPDNVLNMRADCH